MTIKTWHLAATGTAVAGVALGGLLGFTPGADAVDPIELMSDTDRAVHADSLDSASSPDVPSATVSSPDAPGSATITSIDSPTPPDLAAPVPLPAPAVQPGYAGDSPDSIDSPQAPAPAVQPAPVPAPAGDSPDSPDSPEVAPAPAPQPAPVPAPAPDSYDSPDSPDSP